MDKFGVFHANQTSMCLDPHLNLSTASNHCLLLQKEQNVKGGEGPSGKQAVGINNGTR